MRKMGSFGLALLDLIIVATVPFLALIVRFDGVIEQVYANKLVEIIFPVIVLRLCTFYTFGLYNRLWQHASIHELFLIISAVTVSSVLILSYTYIVGISLPQSIHFLSWIFNIIIIGFTRMAVRILKYILRRGQPCQQSGNVLIVGAGEAGAMIAREVYQRYYGSKKIVGFIDDDPNKKNQKLFSTRVLGTRKDIKRIIEEHEVSEVIVAMPSAGGTVMRDIVSTCRASKCTVKVVPGIYELIDGKVSIQQLRNVDLEDLLRRDPVKLDMEQIAGYLEAKCVLVTGAGGSIGSELCRQIAKMTPSMLVLLGKGENSIYEIERELKGNFPNMNVVPIIADIRDQERIRSVFSEYKPQVVFHAAAHKHVPLMEVQPVEAVRNNIFGTKVVAEAADCFKTEIFVMISTDKAVNPTSVMGATKRVAELIIHNMNNIGMTKFVAVRFGNVLGSRGSVIPLFKRQIAAGGPITITHPEMRRYFMTIPEASQLVLQSGAIAGGGEVFVLDMGEPVKIVDMACDLIDLCGLIPHKDITIEFTGLRPGEKLFEELLTAEEGTRSTKHAKIFAANLKDVDEAELMPLLLQLQDPTLTGGHAKELLQKIIVTYKPYQLLDPVSVKSIVRDDAQSLQKRRGPSPKTISIAQ